MLVGVANDIHLDHVKDSVNGSKIKRVARDMSKGLDALILCGDLSVGHLLEAHMKAFQEGSSCPVYFVLGNHDFWCLDEESVWATAKSLPGALDFAGVVELSKDTCLVGVTGWYDTRAGSLIENTILMPELSLASMYEGLAPDKLCINPWERTPSQRKYSYSLSFEKKLRAAAVSRAFADTQTISFYKRLSEASSKDYKTIVIATHFPPWESVSLSPNGPESSKEWLPWSCNINLGYTIESVAEENLKKQFIVLSGHTHNQNTAQIASNLKAISGKAKYKMPKLAHTLGLK